MVEQRGHHILASTKPSGVVSEAPWSTNSKRAIGFCLRLVSRAPVFASEVVPVPTHLFWERPIALTQSPKGRRSSVPPLKRSVCRRGYQSLSRWAILQQEAPPWISGAGFSTLSRPFRQETAREPVARDTTSTACPAAPEDPSLHSGPTDGPCRRRARSPTEQRHH